MLITQETLPLIILAFIWIIGAIFQDLRRREVDNIWNFSLIAFALAYRLALSININNYYYFTNGIIGLIIFLIIGNLLYYGRVFAGGDAKLLIALGTILPLSFNWILNFKIFTVFIFLFLIGGAIYVFIWAIFLTINNFNNFKIEIFKQTKINKKIFLIALILALIWMVIVIVLKQPILTLISLTIIIFPLLLVFAKSVEETCLIKSTKPKNVTIGDWLYRDIKIENKIIKANWEGITKIDLQLLQKKYKKNILIKHGIPFTPGFLIGLILLLILDYFNYTWGLF